MSTGFFIAGYVTLYIESSSGKLDLFRVSFRKEKFDNLVRSNVEFRKNSKLRLVIEQINEL